MMKFASYLALAFAVYAIAEDSSSTVPIVNDGDDAPESDETQKLISQLTIAMSTEVVDENTFAIRDSSKGSKAVHLRIGNTAPTPQGSLNDEDYSEKRRVAQDALGKVVTKQMIWYKPAPDAVQPSNASGIPVVIADVWSTDGRHLGNFLKKEGHLSEESMYESELAKDILTVASEAEKKESYKKLEEALKESEKAKKEAARAARAKEEEEEAAEIESIGLSGYMGLAMVLVIVLGAASNFGRPSNKKVNLNRKKGALERFWMKLKGA